MKTNRLIMALLISANLSIFSQSDSLKIYYYENYPYAYTERTSTFPDKGEPKGIEIEIVQEYVQWLKQKKGINLKITFTLFTDFSAFYNSVKDGNTLVIGLGSVTKSGEREKQVSFSAPYLINQAVLITHGSIAGVKKKSIEEISKVLGSMKAISLAGSSHEVYLKELQSNYINDLQIQFTSKPSAVLDSISSNKKLFGYSDLVSYWSY